MKFTVVWAVGASNALAAMWNSAVDRQAIADAADKIDVDLSRDADRLVSNYGEFFIYEVWPLRVYVELSLDDRFARVTCVQKMR